ncbi:LAME_0D08020g1_1 [Lachancea meyersii CBS 8951]|uniref:LAME_0D08020g1_1 n=1 Tax=Lachancea meyersii CBS 8951 TaxID=1266667 RepID=A0A1G4JAQ3_9SACH|nr:LAME_0D08020g1_1 [Lachancea meyersii CBS 8951]
MGFEDEELEPLNYELANIRKRKTKGIFPVELALWTLLVWGSFALLKTIDSDVPSGISAFFKWHWPVRPGKQSLDKISFANVRNATFAPQLHSIQWISGVDSSVSDKGLFLSEKDDSYVVESVLDKNYSRVLLDSKHFEHDGYNYSVEYVKASPDLSQVLLRSNTTKNWRHSTVGSYFLLDEDQNGLRLLGHGIALVQWSPNSQDLAYVQANDMFLYSTKTHTVSRRITNDGSAQVFNGKPDWVYEEEVFEGDSAMWWSPKGDYLAYLRINETLVHEFPIPYFAQDDADIYPEVRKIKYPKSGSANPQATLMVYDINAQKFSAVEHGDASTLITEVLWVGDAKILAKTSDRCSDVLSVVLVDAEKGASHEVPRKESSEDGWWEITHNTKYVPRDSLRGRDQDGYVDLIPFNGYNHLAYYSPANSTDPVMLTSGEWEVVDGPAAIDFESNNVYFIATKKDSAERHIYSVNLHDPLNIKDVSDTSEDGYFSISFSSGSRFALVSYLGPEVPYQKVVEFKSNTSDALTAGNVLGKTLFCLEENETLKSRLKHYEIPQKTFREMNLGKDKNGHDIIASSYEILPPNFNPKLKDHYPVFFYAYGGPNSQQVAKLFSIGFNQVVSSQLNAIVVVVDGRGTGFKGRDFRALVRDNLGDVEAQDQISAAKQYAAKPFVDAQKISLFGWSYGGYLTLKTLERDAGRTFKYGMSVAPVTDWRLYDSVYTERYMHKPQQNSDGYAKAKVHNASALGETTRFLLMHGSGDDNVHFQNSLKFLDMLDLAGVENYDMHVFPDSDHSIRYHNANNIVYDKLLNWAAQAYDGRFLAL